MVLNLAALKIHISQQCKETLDKLGGYVTEKRGIVELKVGSQLCKDVLLFCSYDAYLSAKIK